MSDIKPAHFNGVEMILGKPHNWDMANGDCEGLPVMRMDGCFVSHWRPNFMQRVSILFGSGLWLWTMAKAHPPVMLTTGRAGKQP